MKVCISYFVFITVFLCSCTPSEIKKKSIEKGSKYWNDTKDYVSTKTQKLSSFIPTEINIDDPNKAFMYWTKIPLENTDVQPIKGKYWQSIHFTLEYEAYLLLKASKAWTDQLIEFNKLEIIEEKINVSSNNTPDWFKPSSDYKLYKEKDNLSNLYLWKHTSSDTIYIYDQIL